MPRVAVQAHVSVPGEQVALGLHPCCAHRGASCRRGPGTRPPHGAATAPHPAPTSRPAVAPKVSPPVSSVAKLRVAGGGRSMGRLPRATSTSTTPPSTFGPWSTDEKAPMEMDRPGGRERDDREVGPMIPAQRERHAVEQDGDVPVGGPPEAWLRFPARIRPDPHERHLAQRLLEGGNRRRCERIESHLHDADAAGRREPLTREDPNLGHQEALRKRIQRVGRDRIGDLRGGAARKRCEPEREPGPDQGHRSNHFAFE